MFRLVLEKAEEPEIKLPTSTGSSKKQESSRKTSISALTIDYAKAFDCVDHNKLWKILKELGIPDHLMLEATLGITDTMEARLQSPLLISQARSRDQGVRPCNSDLSFPLLG